ncbi:EAL domain-containing response regulator [Marinicellulosiphila megalodicopiae]|uniref:EAL domain-containing response regulator n=1 Tax=Marinicellulosiphila megalodicopiae TaxID=2724896 RepID=UPI003BB0F404
MKPTKATIRLLLIHDNQGDAEPLLNILRNNGFSARTHFIASEQELTQVLGTQTWDMAFVKLDTETVDPIECSKIILASEKDIPIIGLLDQYSAEDLTNAMELGLQDVVVESQEDHLHLVTSREFKALNNRRLKRKAQIELKETQKRCQLLLESSKDAITYVHEGMHIFANNTYMEMFGYDDMDELSCMPIMDMIASENVASLKDALKIKSGEHNIDCTGVHENGTHFKIKMTFSPAIFEGETCLQIVIRSNEDNSAELEEKLNEIRQKDLVTGLFNRTHFVDQLDYYYQQSVQSGKQTPLLYLSIIKFAELKSEVGLAGTDLLLKDIAEVLNHCKLENSIITRYRDDVFTVIFPGSSNEEIKEHAKLILQSISEHLFEVDGKTLNLRPLIGISNINEKNESASQALTHAHQSNTQATEEHPINVYDPSDSSNLKDDGLLAQLQHAIEHDQFNIYFQPIVSLRGDSKEHYEASISLKGPDGTEINGSEFLTMAVDSGLSAKIDRWFIAHCATILANQRQKSGQTRLFITISFESIQDAGFIPWFNGVLTESHLPSDAISLQITEEVAQTYLKAAKAFSKSLDVIKTPLSISHFGLIQSDLSINKHLNISYIKVDKSFVNDLSTSDAAQAKLNELVSDIHAREIKSIVTHIESASVMATLWQAGVHYIQGQYLQSPSKQMNYNFSEEE